MRHRRLLLIPLLVALCGFSWPSTQCEAVTSCLPRGGIIRPDPVRCQPPTSLIACRIR